MKRRCFPLLLAVGLVAACAAARAADEPAYTRTEDVLGRLIGWGRPRESWISVSGA